jgi:hypothetical protein
MIHTVACETANQCTSFAAYLTNIFVALSPFLFDRLQPFPPLRRRLLLLLLLLRRRRRRWLLLLLLLLLLAPWKSVGGVCEWLAQDLLAPFGCKNQ